MKHFTKLVLLFLATVLLSSCLWDATEDTTTKGLETKVLDTFSISVPASWKVLSPSDEGLPSPVRGSIALAVSSTELKNGFANNISIIEQRLPGAPSVGDVTSTLEQEMKEDFYSYTLLESGNLEFLDGTNSQILVFDAKYNQNTPKVKYLQVPQVCGNNVYILTLAIDSKIESFERYKYILQTFSCKSEK